MPPTWTDSLRRHPVIGVLVVTCTVAGAVLGMLYLPAEWSLLRRLAAGAFSGAGIGLLCTATKMLG
jgi:hypothetical protein